MEIIVRPGSAGRRFRGKENYRGRKTAVNTKSGKVSARRSDPIYRRRPAPQGPVAAAGGDVDGTGAVRPVTHCPMK